MGVWSRTMRMKMRQCPLRSSDIQSRLYVNAYHTIQLDLKLLYSDIPSCQT